MVKIAANAAFGFRKRTVVRIVIILVPLRAKIFHSMNYLTVGGSGEVEMCMLVEVRAGDVGFRCGLSASKHNNRPPNGEKLRLEEAEGGRGN